MIKIEIEKIKAEILLELSNLPINITYHNTYHTEHVLSLVEELANYYSVSDEDKMILQLSAIFHDTGYLKEYKGNEEIGCEFATNKLKNILSTNIISRIQDVIMATKIFMINGEMRQCPGEDLLRQIICDADLGNFGSINFFEQANNLRTELKNYSNLNMSDLEWYVFEKKLLEKHVWFTHGAKILYEPQKKQNIISLTKRIEDFSNEK